MEQVSELYQASEMIVHTLNLLLGNLGATAGSVHVVTTEGGGTEAGNEGKAGSGGHCEGVCVVVGVGKGGLIVGRTVLWYRRGRNQQGTALFV